MWWTYWNTLSKAACTLTGATLKKKEENNKIQIFLQE